MSEAFVLLLLPVSLALIPLLMAPGALLYFDVTPKVAALLIATGLALFHTKTNALGLAALRSCRAGRWLTYLLAAQAVSILVATIFSHDLALSITGGTWRRSGAVTELALCAFVLLSAARFASAPQTIDLTLKLIAVSCLLTAIYAIAQFFGIDPFLPTMPYHAGEGIWTIVRPPSTMGNANFLATFLIYATLCSAALIRERSTKWNVVFVAAGGLGAIAIVLSGSRSGIIGLLIAMVVLIAGLAPRLRLWILGAMICLAALIALLAATPAGLPLKARVRWSREDAFGGGRLLLWRDSLRMFGRSPLVGFGPDSFPREFPRFQSVKLSRAEPDFYQESPHNALLDSALTAGLPGLAVYLGVLALGFYAAWQIKTTDPRLALCLTAALVGGAVSAQFSSQMIVTQVYPLALIAILCASTSACVRTRASTVRFTGLPYAIAGSALILFAVAVLASDFLAGAFKRSVDAANIDGAVSRYRAVTEYSVPAFTIDLYASRSFARLALQNAPQLTRALAWRNALESGHRAVKTAEDWQNAYFSLAQLYAEQNDVSQTEANLRLATQTAPNWFKPHWILAELLARTGRVPEAREEARTAWNLDAGKDTEVVHTWQMLGSPR
jgi:O-antigen ligase